MWLNQQTVDDDQGNLNKYYNGAQDIFDIGVLIESFCIKNIGRFGKRDVNKIKGIPKIRPILLKLSSIKDELYLKN